MRIDRTQFEVRGASYFAHRRKPKPPSKGRPRRVGLPPLIKRLRFPRSTKSASFSHFLIFQRWAGSIRRRVCSCPVGEAIFLGLSGARGLLHSNSNADANAFSANNSNLAVNQSKTLDSGGVPFGIYAHSRLAVFDFWRSIAMHSALSSWQKSQ